MRAGSGVHVVTHKRVERLRRQAQTATLFEAFAKRWAAHDARRLRWSADYRREVEQSIARHLEKLHLLPLVEVTAPVAAAVLRHVERATPMMAEKVRRRLRGILDFAVEEGLIPGNPLPASVHFVHRRPRDGLLGYWLRPRRSHHPTRWLGSVGADLHLARWQSGHAAACKAVYAGSIPTPASRSLPQQVSSHSSFGALFPLKSASERAHRGPAEAGHP